MGLTAENLAEQYNISREEQDVYALESQRRAARAIEAGHFKGEIVPFEVKRRKQTVIFDTDDTAADVAREVGETAGGV